MSDIIVPHISSSPPPLDNDHKLSTDDEEDFDGFQQFVFPNNQESALETFSNKVLPVAEFDKNVIQQCSEIQLVSNVDETEISSLGLELPIVLSSGDSVTIPIVCAKETNENHSESTVENTDSKQIENPLIVQMNGASDSQNCAFPEESPPNWTQTDLLDAQSWHTDVAEQGNLDTADTVTSQLDENGRCVSTVANAVSANNITDHKMTVEENLITAAGDLSQYSIAQIPKVDCASQRSLDEEDEFSDFQGPASIVAVNCEQNITCSYSVQNIDIPAEDDAQPQISYVDSEQFVSKLVVGEADFGDFTSFDQPTVNSRELSNSVSSKYSAALDDPVPTSLPDLPSDHSTAIDALHRISVWIEKLFPSIYEACATDASHLPSFESHFYQDYVLSQERSSRSMWSLIEDVDSMPALQYRWAESNGQIEFLRCLGIDRRRLALQSALSCLTPLESAFTHPSSSVSTVVAASKSTHEASHSANGTIPLAEFDWKTSGLKNPLAGGNKYGCLVSHQDTLDLQFLASSADAFGATQFKCPGRSGDADVGGSSAAAAPYVDPLLQQLGLAGRPASSSCTAKATVLCSESLCMRMPPTPAIAQCTQTASAEAAFGAPPARAAPNNLQTHDLLTRSGSVEPAAPASASASHRVSLQSPAARGQASPSTANTKMHQFPSELAVSSGAAVSPIASIASIACIATLPSVNTEASDMRPNRGSALSRDAQQFLDTLPDLSFMRSKMLEFPLKF